MMEESETLDYRAKFIRDVISDLKSEGRGFVYNKSQLDEVKKIMDIEIIKDDGFCIWIRTIKKRGNIC